MGRGKGWGGSGTADVPDDWDKLSDELARYALPILCAWMRKGTIKAKVSEAKVLGAGRILDGLRLNGDDATALAGDVIVKALRYFRRRGLTEWDPEKGRSCEAYFLTCCLMMVPDAYQAWDRWRPRPTADRVYLDDLGELNEPASPERFERLVEAAARGRRRDRTRSGPACGLPDAHGGFELFRDQ